jgi:biotin carboxyl carrier protein
VKLTAQAGDKVHEIVIERRDATFLVTVDGEPFEADARKLSGGFYTILMGARSYAVSVEASGDSYCVRHGAGKKVVRLTDPSRRARAVQAAPRGPTSVNAVMPGKVVRVLVQEGDQVAQGQGLVVIEAMKMENEIASPKAGRVTSLPVEPGRAVEAGATLVVVE